MDILRCQSPEMAEKEIWMHLLAYNLIRGEVDPKRWTTQATCIC